MNEPEIVQIRYSITFTVEEFEKIIKKDDEEITEFGHNLFSKLRNETGAEDIEYAGMFGPHLWFTLDKFDHLGRVTDLEDEINNIVDIIKNYIK